MRHRAIALALLILACRSQPVTLTARDTAAMSPDSGAVGMKLLADPDAPQVELGPDEDYREPYLYSWNPTPEYPPQLIAKRLPPHVVVLRVTFDEEGKAIDVAHSPLGAPTEGEYRERFETAAREALVKWKCSPPRVRKFRPGPDNDNDGKPDYRILSAQRVLKTFFDVSFEFAVVNGVPVVKRK